MRNGQKMTHQELKELYNQKVRIDKQSFSIREGLDYDEIEQNEEKKIEEKREIFFKRLQETLERQRNMRSPGAYIDSIAMNRMKVKEEQLSRIESIKQLIKKKGEFSF